MMMTMIDTTSSCTNVDTEERQHRPSGVEERRVVRQPRSRRRRRRRRGLLVHQNNSHHIGITITTPSSTPLVFVRQLLLVLFVWGRTLVAGQFNEPPGQRREQTYRVLEFEASNINQHYPGDLRYYCTFRGKWSAERHPHDFPASPSFSAPILVSHSKNYRMWTGTETVTAGVEYLAEVTYKLCNLHCVPVRYTIGRTPGGCFAFLSHSSSSIVSLYPSQNIYYYFPSIRLSFLILSTHKIYYTKYRKAIRR